MPSLSRAVEPLAQRAISRILDVPADSVDPVVRDSPFADVQLNAALALARAHGRNPFELAELIAAELSDGGPIAEAYASRPGYVNIVASDAWLAGQVEAMEVPETLAPTGRHVVIDYSSPNVAKEMHVGHLRTTVVGDALARMREWRGDRVTRQNHIGDWGTPFGMLIEHYLELTSAGEEVDQLTTAPNEFYQAARARFDSDPDFAARARSRVVALQAGEPETIEHWTRLTAESKKYFTRVYRTLGISLTDDDLAGESSYNAELADLCDELERRGLARMSEGALCAFPAGFTGRDGQPAALIIRKSDGGYGYATTDLATIRHRAQTLHADLAIYVIGSPQAMHLEMVWQVAREAGWLPPTTEPVHVKIGNVLGADNKMLRTRSGDSVKLFDLLDATVERARTVLSETRAFDSPEDLDRAARIIGIGAVKYADLSVGHETEYVFDLDRMVAQTGNTAPYLQYAVRRIRSLVERVRAGAPAAADARVTLGLPEERALALALLSFEDAALTAADKLEPHRLCAYLFDLAQRFSSFYDAAPVGGAASAELRESRLLLCEQTERVLVRGLTLLGIDTPSQM
ncbi:arginine--tRNA ligase [Streptomyces sp. AC495_CC817]|uniref:arginine--tRNA ligase n=1 Tax=Streptomyces sp. AC495_CC817 TaxID=2823900 RepID=UPI001C2748F9|nr:arginine--tRNA ligase [Streptomyces sp. AC495_CC817]